MKDFAYYSENPLPYPKKENHAAFYLYQRGAVILSGVPPTEVIRYLGQDPAVGKYSFGTLEQVAKSLGYTLEISNGDEAFKAAKQRYAAEASRLHKEFANDLFVEHGVEDHPGRNAMFDYAWNESHSSGYSEVADTFDKIVTLINEIDAARANVAKNVTQNKHAVWKVDWTERERGWDPKYSHSTYYLTDAIARVAIKNYWDAEQKKNGDNTPEWYLAPEDPKLVEITQEVYDKHFNK